MHIWETLWSLFNWTDWKDFAKIYGAAPADPSSTLGAYDAISRVPIWTFHGLVVVFGARVDRVCFELIVNATLFRSKLLKVYQFLTLVFMRLCLCIVSHCFFGPPLNQFQAKIAHTIFDRFSKLLGVGLVFQNVVLPSNIRVDDRK